MAIEYCQEWEIDQLLQFCMHNFVFFSFSYNYNTKDIPIHFPSLLKMFEGLYETKGNRDISFAQFH